MIGRELKTSIELRQEKRRKNLDNLKTQKEKMQGNLKSLEEKLQKEMERDALPKAYFEPLDDFFTPDEILELTCFFDKDVQYISTDLTSIC